MPTVQYKAKVKDGAGREERFNVSIEISKQECQLIISKGNDSYDSELAIVTEWIVDAGLKSVQAAGPWTCFCGKILNAFHIHGNSITYMGRTITIEDEPAIFCGEIKCRNKAMRHVKKKTKELEAKGTHGCFVCDNRGTVDEMFK